jgi:hypothetical protein
VEVGPGVVSSGAGGGAGCERPLQLGLVDACADRRTSDDDGVLRRTRSRGRTTEWLQSLARRRPRSAPGGRHSARAPHAWRRARRSRACTVRRTSGRTTGTRYARRHARFPFNPDPAWKTACVRRLSTAASGACRPSFQCGWTQRTRPRRAEGPPQGSRSTATSSRRLYAGSACTRHVDSLQTKDARTRDMPSAAPRRPRLGFDFLYPSSKMHNFKNRQQTRKSPKSKVVEEL